MGRRNGPYGADFPVGSSVRIAERALLERFMQEWKYQNPIEQQQLAYAGKVAVIRKLGYYHGGDELYWLEGVPGVWHERCLEDAAQIAG